MKHGTHMAIGQLALRVVQKFVPKVTKVTDADSDLHVQVTAQDDKVSKKKDHNECAMAVAVKRQEHAASVIISSGVAYVIKGTQAKRYKVPEAVGREVTSFDRGGGFVPGEYVLKAPPKSMRLGRRAHGNGGSHGPTTGGAAKRFVHHTANIRENLNTGK